ncbi:hypothetical protein LCGC14_0123560 [marine sediment metagenome]|uniref:DUF4221 domain-containing protein n=1 Tax=marine sediment metagenome TaxID=412755 RepID=A0A0F9VM51_9ZZZZ|nr:DUF4221 family protein [Maribacter sp.]HDZ05811.1 DUF4221 domain-containing protein [Maribacter sp.]|tara:strand:+ start:2176 stop:3333 length:1158 start_codon:yes stop_codon:yes gene_type:complete
MKKSIFLSIFIFLFFSCQQSPIKKAIEDTYTIDLNTKLELPLANSDYFSWYSTVIYIQDTPYLFRENNLYENIQVYNLATKQLIKEIKLKKEGPNGIRSFVSFGFLPESLDEFVLVNRLEEMFRMENDSVIEKYDLQFDILGGTAASISPRNDAKLIQFSDSIFGIPQVKQMDWSKSSFLEQSVFAIYDKNRKEIRDAPIYFPKDYQEKCWVPEMLDPTFCYNENKGKVIFSYPATHNLIEYDYTSNTSTEIQMDSNRYFKTIESFDVYNCSEERQRQDYYFKSNPRYLFITYDKYRKLYYRFFSIPPEQENIMKNSLIYGQIGVVVLNEKYKIINQTIFKPFNFYPKDYFVTKEGLWLSNNNPQNPEFDEELLKFTLLKVETNE